MGLLNTILRNTGYTNPITAIPTAIYNKATTGEFVPGVDVGAARKQFFGTDEERSTNQDILDNFTFSGRDGQIQIGELPKTAKSPTPDPENYSQDEAGINQYYADLLAAQQQAAAQAAAQASAANQSYNRGFLADQRSELERLLSKTNQYETQGLEKILNEYNKQKDLSERDRERTMSDYGEQELGQNKNKVSSFSKIDEGANRAYRSLAQIIGRAAGSSSSAFRELLPDVLGKDISGKRGGVLEDYGANMQRIGKAKNQYELDFEDVLKDLEDQRKATEESFMSGVLENRQGINSRLMDVISKQTLNENPYADYSAIKSQIAPLQQQNIAMSDRMDNFYNTYKPNYTVNKAVADKPELGQFTVDRSTIGQQGQQVENPYSQLLRRRLQEQG